MKPTNYTVPILVIGLAHAFAVWWGLSLLGLSIRTQTFKSDPPRDLTLYNRGDAAKSVVSLSEDRFAIVEGDTISVYGVDFEGKVSRLTSTDTSYRQLQPYKRREADPTPAP